MQSVLKIVRDRLQAAPPAANHPDADLLTAFAEQSLPAVERATVLDHLARCRDCRDVVALALPPTEILETEARPARSAWLTWPVLRWGFVGAGVAIVASIGVLRLQERPNPSAVAVNSSPRSPITRQEARPQLTAAPSPIPSAKQDTTTLDKMGEVGKETVIAGEQKLAPTAAPPSYDRVQSFHGVASGAFGAPAGGPKPPSQFQNNMQQQASNNALGAVPNPPEVKSPPATQSPGANAVVAIPDAPAPIPDTDGARSEAGPRDQYSDAPLFADKSIVSKTKLPVTPPARGLISGHVVDSSGAVVPNARITVTPATAGKSASAVTDSQGAFLIADLPTGNYKAQAQAQGFNTTILDLNYDAIRPSTYNFTLNVGSVSETVELSSVQNALSLPSTVGRPINSTARNFTELVSLSPGLLPRWTVSAAGALQRSFDQGKSWQTVDVNVSAMSSAKVEIARESRTKDVSREKDADKKLLEQEVGSPIFRAVTVAGFDVWAGGSAGALYHSLDAGNHWTRVVPSSTGTPLTGDIISLEFADSENGKVTTSTSEVWTTRDAGKTWQKQ